uniref:G protein-coupled receptor n=1 Tax=Steinernema glaseri TaxID=37863 RepID=A0A1I7Z4T4_9BILA
MTAMPILISLLNTLSMDVQGGVKSPSNAAGFHFLSLLHRETKKATDLRISRGSAKTWPKKNDQSVCFPVMYLPSDSNVFKTMIAFVNLLAAHRRLPSSQMQVYIDGCFVGTVVVDYILQIGVMLYPGYVLYPMPVFFYFLVGLASVVTAYRLLFISYAAISGTVNSRAYVVFCGFRGCFVGTVVVDYILQVGVMLYPGYVLYPMPVFFYFLVGLASVVTVYRLLFISYAAVSGMVNSRAYIVFCGFRVVFSLALFPVFAFFVCLFRNIEALYIYGIVGVIAATIMDILYFSYLKAYHKKNLVQSTCDSTVLYGRA